MSYDDLGGRIMAHAFHDELNNLGVDMSKTAGIKASVKAELKRRLNRILAPVASDVGQSVQGVKTRAGAEAALATGDVVKRVDQAVDTALGTAEGALGAARRVVDVARGEATKKRTAHLGRAGSVKFRWSPDK